MKKKRVMRPRNEINFKNFSHLPVELDADPLAGLLSQPPSNHGLQAQYRLREVEYWERLKTEALLALEDARDPIAVLATEASEASMCNMASSVSEPTSTVHADTVAEYRQQLQWHQEALDKQYKEFLRVD